jgi:hypothetical protein
MVYVDSMRARYGRMVMCHMVADTTEELLGIQRRWLQDAGTPREHFDVSLSKRAKALRCGAVEIGMRDLAHVLNRKRRAEPHP